MAGLPGINLDSVVNSVLKMNRDEADPARDFDVAILVDESLTPDFITYARKEFTPVRANANVHVESYYDDPVEVYDNVEILVILANASPWTGACYAMAKNNGVATVVVAEHLANVIKRSEEMQFPIDYGDLLAPEAIGMRVVPVSKNPVVQKAVDVCTNVATNAVDLVGRKLPKQIIGRPLVSENATALPLGKRELSNQEVYEKLFDQLADWVMANCEEFRSAFANAFAFAKPAEVDQITRRISFENAVTGAVFFIPGADFPLMTLNQLKMLIMIERSYGYGLDKQTIVEGAAVVIGALCARTLARSLCSRIPVLSWIIKTASGYFVTLLMGRVISAYCEKGRALPAPIARLLDGVSKGEPTGNTVVARIED